MNIYAIIEDGETGLFAAETMVAGLERAFAKYERSETTVDATSVDDTEPQTIHAPWTPEERKEERAHWEENILQSVALVGALSNPEDLADYGSREP